MGYMLAAYAVIWILTFVFIGSIFLRQNAVRRDLQLVEQLVEADHETSDGTGQATAGSWSDA